MEPGLNVWPHEQKTAEALACAGYVVKFIRQSEIPYEKTADVLINGERWEFKAPTAANLKAIERNLKRGRWQSSCIVFDSRRMKGLPDKAILREVTKRAFEVPHVDKLLYVSKQGSVVDIK